MTTSSGRSVTSLLRPTTRAIRPHYWERVADIPVRNLDQVDETGGYDDWVALSDFGGGVGNQHRGEDYWVRINNGGVSELYLDVHAMDDDIHSFANAVYIEYDYGHAGIPRNVRQGVASLAAATLVEEAVIEIPQNTTLYNVETKAEELRGYAEEFFGPYLPDDASLLEALR